jgi:AcrR family transcriptional regulator
VNWFIDKEFAMSRKAVERETRKQFILGTARRLLDENALEDVSMDDIASAAEYTRRTLYDYFKSRDEILLSILIDDLTARWSRQKKALNQAETGLGKIVKWAEALYAYTLKQPHSIRLQTYWDFHGVNPGAISKSTFAAFEKINNELAEGLRDIFRLGVSDGTLRPDLPIDMTISQFLYSFRSILNRAFSSSYSFAAIDGDEYVKHYLDLFVRGIRK